MTFVLNFSFANCSQEGPMIIEEEDEDGTGAIKAPGGYYYFGAAKNLPGVRALLKPKSTSLLVDFCLFL